MSQSDSAPVPADDASPAAPDGSRSGPGSRPASARASLVHWLFVVATYIMAGLSGAMLVWMNTERVTPQPTYVYRSARGAELPDPVNTPPHKYDWSLQPDPDFPIPPYARFLRGVKIVLDPGHVGQDISNKDAGFKTGPTGLKEKDANLRVTKFLREFLVAAGADVTLTRERDVNLKLPDSEDLASRAQVANRLKADLFISLHHNAGPKSDANHSAVFYHMDPDHSPPSRDAARYLLTGLNDALRLESHLESALVSDQIIYATGFAVLRSCDVPAVLVESSFFTNLAEEERLRDPLYNRREAYGLFVGLARWAQAGLPRIKLNEYVRPTNKADGTIGVALDDGLSSRGGWGADKPKIAAQSIIVRLDGKNVDFRFDPGSRRVTIPLPKGTQPPKSLYVDFENTFNQHVIHPEINLVR